MTTTSLPVFISLGAGVQSSTMALMAAEGRFGDMPQAAIFADTGWEPASVYEHLDWLEKHLPFPVRRVGQPTLKEDVANHRNSTGHDFMPIPAFKRKDDGEVSITRRQCTSEYKLRFILEAIRQELGYPTFRHLPRKEPLVARSWIGISTDEIVRQKPSRHDFVRNEHPLIKANLSRQDCKDWFDERYPGRLLPRSACVGCPYHRDSEWLSIKRSTPAEFEEACVIEDRMREHDPDLFFHRGAKPLRETVFKDELNFTLFDPFTEECEGMCGV